MTEVKPVDHVRDNIIYEAIAGSHAFGTNIEGSDNDIRGAFIPPPHMLIGLDKIRDQREQTDDEHHYELAEWFYQMAKGAVNWVEVAFIDDRFVTVTSEWWDYIKEHRSMFLSKQVARKSLGFIGNMRRRSMAQLQQGSITPAKAQKQAMHAVRTGREIVELLDTGKMNVYRGSDKDNLLLIRLGEISLDEAFDEIDSLVIKIEDKIVSSPLREACDRATVDAILTHSILSYWKFQRWMDLY